MHRARACLAGLLAALAAQACAERPAPDASAGAVPASSREGAAAVANALRFIENDAPKARAEAKQRGVPLFVEAWAPW